MKALEYILNNEAEVLAFLKKRYPLYHLSNVFFRDVQYGIQTLLERREMKVGYKDAEQIARAFVGQLEKKKMFRPIDSQSWVLYNEEFRTPPTKPSAPVAKPAPTAPAVPRPAGGLPPLKSGTPSPAPGGLPPLKSAAQPVSAPQPAAAEKGSDTVATSATTMQPEQAVAQPAPAPKSPHPATPGKALPPLGKRPLPPIKSSKPVGGG